jgi:hypothetical protein
VGLAGEGWCINAQFGSGKHGNKGQHEQRATAQSKGNQKSDRGAAKAPGQRRKRVKEPNRNARNKQGAGH